MISFSYFACFSLVLLLSSNAPWYAFWIGVFSVAASFGAITQLSWGEQSWDKRTTSCTFLIIMSTTTALVWATITQVANSSPRAEAVALLVFIVFLRTTTKTVRSLHTDDRARSRMIFSLVGQMLICLIFDFQAPELVSGLQRKLFALAR